MTSFDKSFIKAFTDAPHLSDEQPQPAAPHIAPPSAPAKRPAAAAERTAAEALKPLSSFATRPKVHDSWRAMLEVDRFQWPPTCDALLAQSRADWDRFADGIVEGMASGQKCLGIGSVGRDTGRSTIVLTLARHLATRGMRLVVVDADIERPELATACGVSAGSGWDDLLASELPLGESLIAAIEDGVTLLPWRTPRAAGAALPASIKAGGIFGTLREHYDLVLVDLPPLGHKTTIVEFAAFAKAIHLDQMFLVNNLRERDRASLAECYTKLQRAGVNVAGMIENFAAGPQPPSGPSMNHGGHTLAAHS